MFLLGGWTRSLIQQRLLAQCGVGSYSRLGRGRQVLGQELGLGAKSSAAQEGGAALVLGSVGQAVPGAGKTPGVDAPRSLLHSLCVNGRPDFIRKVNRKTFP